MLQQFPADAPAPMSGIDVQHAHLPDRPRIVVVVT